MWAGREMFDELEWGEDMKAGVGDRHVGVGEHACGLLFLSIRGVFSGVLGVFVGSYCGMLGYSWCLISGIPWVV